MTDEERKAWYRGYKAANYDEQRWFKLGEKCGRAQGELIGFLCGVIAVIVYCMIGG